MRAQQLRVEHKQAQQQVEKLQSAISVYCKEKQQYKAQDVSGNPSQDRGRTTGTVGECEEAPEAGRKQ